ncbi:hypothetical protein L9F63_013616 [Diploptera punctata]|uniref:Peptidase S1 domain-containing protein n=1 Tax=Diploptera punctata TaxID=6984 RepID=A0AAD8ELI0_DIPPU|nr:hypothetical protein L9F63_013616 [Diploptera punctata]
MKFLVIVLSALLACGSAEVDSRFPGLRTEKPILDGRIVGGSTTTIASYPYQCLPCSTMKFLVIVLSALLACGSAEVDSRFPGLRTEKPILDGRIVGGSTTTIASYPYQLSLRYGGSHICGASIISANWALSAAHCIVGSASTLTLRAGSTYSNSGGTIHQVSQATRHASYSSSTLDYDIAVLRVSSAFSLGSNIQVVSMETGTVAAGTNAVVSGWGTTSEGGSASTTLRQVTVPVVSDSSCSSSYAAYGGITARMICAGYTSGGRDACQGDSGGPLVANGRLIGVVSWGVGCARAGFPGVYAKVSNLRSWVSTQTGV